MATRVTKVSPAAVFLQQEVNDILKKVDADIREFTGCLKQAHVVKNAEESKACEERLRLLNGLLQKHRAAIRTFTSKIGSAHTSAKKLGAARASIETETRKLKDVEKRLKASMAVAGTSVDDSDTVAESAMEEVKVLADQLLRSDSEDSSMVDELICKICLTNVVGCQPILTRCSHLFCGDCTSKWFAANPTNNTWAQRAKAGGSVPCPVCKEMLNEDLDLHPVCAEGNGGSAFLWKMLAGTRIVCGNHCKCRPDGNCNWAGEYGSYQEHIRACQNEPILEDTTAAAATTQLDESSSAFSDSECSTRDSDAQESEDSDLECAEAGAHVVELSTKASDEESGIKEEKEDDEDCDTEIADAMDPVVASSTDAPADEPVTKDEPLASLIGALLELKTKQCIEAEGAAPHAQMSVDCVSVVTGTISHVVQACAEVPDDVPVAKEESLTSLIGVLLDLKSKQCMEPETSPERNSELDGSVRFHTVSPSPISQRRGNVDPMVQAGRVMHDTKSSEKLEFPYQAQTVKNVAFAQQAQLFQAAMMAQAQMLQCRAYAAQYHAQIACAAQMQWAQAAQRSAAQQTFGVHAVAYAAQCQSGPAAPTRAAHAISGTQAAKQKKQKKR